MNTKPPLLDTNILVYLFDRGQPEKRAIARALVEGCFLKKGDLSVSVQNLAEFAVVMTEKVERPLPGETVSRFVRDILAFSGWNVVRYDGRCVSEAVILGERYRLHFWDALLVSTMLQHGMTVLYSEDAHFSRVPEIQTINPF